MRLTLLLALTLSVGLAAPVAAQSSAQTDTEMKQAAESADRAVPRRAVRPTPQPAPAARGGGSPVTVSDSPGVDIPDNGYTGTGANPAGFGPAAGMVCTDLEFSSGTVYSAEVELGITHTWIGDLTVKVRSPSGTVVAPMVRPLGGGAVNPLADDGTGCCGDSSNLDAGSPITFRDGAARDAETMGASLSGTEIETGVFAPNNDQAFQNEGSFSAFAGEDAGGDWTVCVGDAAPGDAGTFDSVALTLFKDDDGRPRASFTEASRAVSEGVGSVALTIALSDYPEADATVTVSLVSGDPADIGGFTSGTATFPLNGPLVQTVSVPITDDLHAEPDEVLAFQLSVVPNPDGSPPLVGVGEPDITGLLLVDNDGVALAVTLPLVDEDDDDADDGGPRLVSLAVSGVTAGALSAAAGGGAVWVLVDGALVEADPALLLVAGQPVLVDVTSGTTVTVDGTRPSGTVDFTAARTAGPPEATAGGGVAPRLIAVGNPTTGVLAFDALQVAGGTLADIVLVFDPSTASFRPVSLAGLGTAPAVAVSGGVVLQVVPDGAPSEVTVTTPTASSATTAAPIDDAPYVPMADETAIRLTLRDAGGAHIGDTAVLRFLPGGTDGVDAYDGLDMVSPLGATLAVDGGPLAALSLGPLVPGAARLVPLVVSAPAGSVVFDAETTDEIIANRPVVVELLDHGVAHSLADGPVTIAATGVDGEFDGRFAVRVSLGAGVAAEDGPEARALSVFPNPVAGRATVRLTGVFGHARVAVYDVLGREVAVLHDGPVAGDADATVEGLTPGVYTVRLVSEAGIEARSLTVIR